MLLWFLITVKIYHALNNEYIKNYRLCAARSSTLLPKKEIYSLMTERVSKIGFRICVIIIVNLWSQKKIDQIIPVSLIAHHTATIISSNGTSHELRQEKSYSENSRIHREETNFQH